MNNKKIALILSAAISLTTIAPTCTYAYTSNGWNNSNGVWYYYQNGSVVTGWKYINGSWYYLNSNGAMATGWKNVNGTWYYLENSGAMATGWKNVNGTWYYLENSGAMATGWKNVNGTWYYLDNSGAMATGWKYINGNWYYLNNSGAMVTGLQNINGNLYYLENSGEMLHDTTKTINGIEYSIDSNGVCTEDDTDKTYNQGINQFTSSFASDLLYNENRGENNICSPVSVYMALSVLSGGAEGETKDDLLNVLNAKNSDNFAKEVNDLRNSLTFNKKNNMCLLANSIWLCNRPDIAKKIKFNEENINKIAKDYKADVFQTDLSSDEGAKQKAKWISDNTKGKLGEDYKAFKAKEDAAMEIFNTLYFNDQWKYKFYKESTKKDEFTLEDNNKVKVDFMNKYSIEKAYENNEYKVSSLPFKSGNNMVFVLPKGDKTPYDILNDSKKLNSALNSLSSNKASEKEVDFKVPKFEVRKFNSLNNTMKRIGLGRMYGDEADFSKFVTDGSLYVSNIIQDTFMVIDEEGVEAAAYTEIEMNPPICPKPGQEPEYEKMELHLDRPFIYAIMSNDNVPLFVGVVNNLTVK